MAAPSPIERYFAAGYKPWAEGYWEYRWKYTLDALSDVGLMQRFRTRRPLPSGYGQRLDERVVEYPWVLSHLFEQPGTILDAGGTLSYGYLLDLPVLNERTILVYSLTLDSEFVPRSNVGYLFGDLRYAALRDAAVNNIVCISTLEHVGMDNTQVYAAQKHFREFRPEAYRLAIKDFQRVLAPGGRLYVTVPYGLPEQHGWLQQFDQEMLEDVISNFGGQLEELTFFRYAADGWQLAEMAECRTARYFDIHSQKDFDPDYAAAARAVACIALVKPSAPSPNSRGAT